MNESEPAALPGAENRVVLQPTESLDKSNERILFQNEACAVINKLIGESSEEPRVTLEGELFPVHRLDLPVSGCLLLARDAEAAAFLGAAFTRASGAQGRADDSARVKKRYWAVIEKPPNMDALPAEAELVHWLYENRKTNKSFALPWEGDTPPQGGRGGRGKLNSQRPKKAVLRYRMAGQGERYLFMEIDLVTGRHHQIRAQLAAMGLHVKGDLKYGARRSEKGGGLRLHARSLTFPNPRNPNERITVTAPPPSMDPLWRAFCEAAE